MSRHERIRKLALWIAGPAILLWFSSCIDMRAVAPDQGNAVRMVVPFAAYLAGIVLSLYVLDRVAAHALARRRRRAAFAATLAFLLLMFLHESVVVEFRALTTAYVVGWQRVAECPCDESFSNKECLVEESFDVARCWSSNQIRLSQIAVALSYVFFAGFFGVLWGTLVIALPAKRVFICYRRADSGEVAARIDRELAYHFSRSRVFFDVKSDYKGKDYRKVIKEYGKRCDAFLIVIGPSWLAELEVRHKSQDVDQVVVEIEQALKSGAKVLPLRVGGAEMPKESELPEKIKQLHVLDGITINEDAEELNVSMQKVIQEIER